MIETLLIAMLLYTGWRLLRWTGRTILSIIRGTVRSLRWAHSVWQAESQAGRDRMAVEQLLREVEHV
jgi:hypothetical protein